MEVFRNQRMQTPFDLAVAAGYVPGAKAIDKYGRAPDCDQNVPTDIWSAADGVTSTDLWVPPTEARVHQIASTDTADSSAGTGVRTIRVFYLADWDTPETSVDITMDGTNDVATPSCVIIHRIQTLTAGSGGVAAGTITATADTDNTITAIISQGKGQTEMAIYGWSSKEDLYLCGLLSRIQGAPGASVIVSGELYYMPDPGTNAANNTLWINKEPYTLSGNDPAYPRILCIPKKLSGPGILKMQVTVTSANNNLEATGVFDAYILRND